MTENDSDQKYKLVQQQEQNDLDCILTSENVIDNTELPIDKPLSAMETSTEDQPAETSTCTIVGIGASAGGMEALTRLLEKLPNNTGMAFVVIQHMDPQHESVLKEILSQTISMPVRYIEEKTVVESDHVYLVSPDKTIWISGGVLNSIPREVIEREHMPIDFFMESLAKDQDSRAIGVVLSGSVSDGSRGLREIKTAGGITFAQKPETGNYDSMPLNAIATGFVDYVLSPEEIAHELAEIAHSNVSSITTAETSKLYFEGENDFKQIYDILLKYRGINFSEYRELTLKRRILRRMILNRIEKLGDYVNYLRENPIEVEDLYQDMLINVTNFFRDAETFETLKSRVFPAIIKDRAPNEPIRIWVPGCSTGEEAYSIAIVLIEFLEDDSYNTPIQIFATDINESLIDKARSGKFSDNIVNDVSPERLRRFFVKLNDGYQVSKSIRDMFVFAKHNMVKDPPFSRLDLISCRNVIIYFGRSLQKKLFPVFHYALKNSGHLLLGSSESIGAYANLFNMVDKKHRIYSKKAIPTPLMHEIAAREHAAATMENPNKHRMIISDTGLKFNLIEEADRIVLNHHTPAGVIVDSEMEIVQFRGHTGDYLEPSAGKPSLKITKMVRDGLSLGLYNAIMQAKKDNIPVRKDGLQVCNNAVTYRVNINVIPIQEPYKKDANFLILFEKAINSALPEWADTDNILETHDHGSQSDENIEIVRLKHELTATKEYLQSIVAQYEFTNEALRAANETIQTSNEELQSMNEELETAKEELQSANEELMTLNDEVQDRNQELSEVSSDLSNLFRSLNIPVVMLSNNLGIRRFNPAAEKVFNLIATDVGRPITDINTSFVNFDLEQNILEVIDTLNSKEAEVQDRHDCWYSVQIRPYRTSDNKIDGVIITFVNIDVIKKSLTLTQEARGYAEAIVETIREPLLVLNIDYHIELANRAFYQTFKVAPEETLNRLVFDLGNGQWDIGELRALLEEIYSKATTFDDFVVVHDFPYLGLKKMIINARQIVDPNNQTKLILMAISDVGGSADE
ncbi:MAG: chemotaxis protein CheB [Acidobacteriota bacterium]